MTAAFSQGRLQGWEGGCAARAAPSCPSEQGLCTPGVVCWGRDSAACQGQHSACPGSSLQSCEEKLWVEGETPREAGQGPSVVEKSPHGSGLLTDPDQPRIFTRGYVKSKEG